MYRINPHRYICTSSFWQIHFLFNIKSMCTKVIRYIIMLIFFIINITVHTQKYLIYRLENKATFCNLFVTFLPIIPRTYFFQWFQIYFWYLNNFMYKLCVTLWSSQFLSKDVIPYYYNITHYGISYLICVLQQLTYIYFTYIQSGLVNPGSNFPENSQSGRVYPGTKIFNVKIHH